jgi:hypothetical protein
MISAQTMLADRTGAEAFFAKYVALESAFDASLADLYSNQRRRDSSLPPVSRCQP